MSDITLGEGRTPSPPNPGSTEGLRLVPQMSLKDHPLFQRGVSVYMVLGDEERGRIDQVLDQKNHTVVLRFIDSESRNTHEFSIKPPAGGWRIIEDWRSVSDLSVGPYGKVGVEELVRFLIEERGRMPTAIPAILEDMAAAGWWGNWSGLLAYSGTFRPEDCSHEFFRRGIDCTRYSVGTHPAREDARALPRDEVFRDRLKGL